MSIQKDLEGLINEAYDAMELVREKLIAIGELNADLQDLIGGKASVFSAANNALDEIYLDIEDLDA
jgi:hypothetical protein